MQQENSANLYLLATKPLLIPQQEHQGEFSHPVEPQGQVQKQQQQSQYELPQQKGYKMGKEQDELIPCQKCGYLQTFEDLDSHPDQCSYQDIQCQKCQGKIPLALMSHHRLECPASKNVSYKNFAQKEKHEKKTYSKPQKSFQQNKFQPILKRPSWSKRKLEELQERIQLRRLNLQQFQSQLKTKGLSLQTISTFPLSQYVSDEKEDQCCVICQSSFKYKEELITLPCFHRFHPECVHIWFQQKSNCPTCKSNLNEGHKKYEILPSKSEWMHI